MLRTPKNAKRHPRLCTCKPCTDPHTEWAKALNRPRHTADSWQAVDLKRTQPASHHEPEVTPPADSLDTFAADMEAQNARIRTGPRTDTEENR